MVCHQRPGGPQWDRLGGWFCSNRHKCGRLSRWLRHPRLRLPLRWYHQVPLTRRPPFWLKQWSGRSWQYLPCLRLCPGWTNRLGARKERRQSVVDGSHRPDQGRGWQRLDSATFVSTANTDYVPVVQVTGSGSLPPSMVVPPAPVPGAPLITTTDYVNLRSGPGTNYPVIGNAAPGASTTPTGISADGAWFQFAVPTSFYPAGFLWVSSSFVVAINTSNLPVVNAPPPPAAVYSSQPTNTPQRIAPSFLKLLADGGSVQSRTPVLRYLGLEEHRDKCLGGWGSGYCLPGSHQQRPAQPGV